MSKESRGTLMQIPFLDIVQISFELLPLFLESFAHLLLWLGKRLNSFVIKS